MGALLAIILYIYAGIYYAVMSVIGSISGGPVCLDNRGEVHALARWLTSFRGAAWVFGSNSLLARSLRATPLAGFVEMTRFLNLWKSWIDSKVCS